ncbi:hypothetical protein AVEN_186004-1 [Araneus ventricosus]|uniref:Uncharacterized protein n=1 Tax=Araneus ventricosus TaxID=182803 RepID=A0A4Y2MKM0_ARAVE|nr:hypothetical protein AVEN_234138-2 [Araneus ventricosus]GBN26324.1 hypothetical protein AVEN_117901-1 [Araneus ventricosus]GBN26397.1 hypothetical protein AVEN_168604-1 [Araneus ventricosus]GBN26405.1 hypothetical protein AVEN_186004-1 [Araneus ventricosus]
MADQTPDLTQLVSSIPQIVITEPSPFRAGTTTETSTATSAAVETVPVTSPAGDIVVPASGADSTQDSDEFKDPDCELCEEESSEKPAEVVMEVDAQVPVQPSERERNEETEDDFRNTSVENCFERCMRALAWFNESKYMLIVQFLLLSIPISAGFMGAKYLDKCPLSSETPVFLFMMGVAGTIVIICRILLISRKILLPTHREWQVLRVLVIVGNLAVIVCLATEMFSFFRTAPSFEMGSAHYCHEIFYKYTFWANWTCLVVIAFLMFLQLPNCSVVNFQNDVTP